MFLGWVRGRDGCHYYLRQLRDWKASVEMEGIDERTLTDYGETCAWALARGHARTGERASDQRVHRPRRQLRRSVARLRSRLRRPVRARLRRLREGARERSNLRLRRGLTALAIPSELVPERDLQHFRG